MPSPAEWLSHHLNTSKAFAICLAILAVTLPLNIWLLRQTSHETNAAVSRLSSDEQVACQIQSRGLPAQRLLGSALNDLYTVVTQPLTPDQRARSRQPGSATALAAYRALGRDLGGFLAYERNQPSTRNCAFSKAR